MAPTGDRRTRLSRALDAVLRNTPYRAGWFGPKVVGFGVGPRSAEGWVVTALYAIAAVGLGRASRGHPQAVMAVAWPTVIFAFVVAYTYRGD